MDRLVENEPPVKSGLVRQLFVFPPDKIAKRSGLVRDHFILLEFSHGTVYHLQVSCDFPHTELTRLVEIIKDHEGLSSSPEATAAFISWTLGIAAVKFRELDLASPSLTNWPLRASALERCRRSVGLDESPSMLADRVALAQKELADDANAALTQFIGNLDENILALTPLWGRMPLARYNYFAAARDARVRRYRIQAASVMPALVAFLCSDATDARKLSDMVDSGEPLVSGLASTYRVRLNTARHALGVPAHLTEIGGLSALTRSLDYLIPDRFPRGNDWTVFYRLIYEVIPKISNRNPASPLNGAILAAICRNGWTNAEQQLSRLCVDDSDAALFKDFLGSYRKSLAWDIVQSGSQSGMKTHDACAAVVEVVLAKVGVLHLFQAARSYPSLFREAQSELYLRHEMLRGNRWQTVINEPMTLKGCLIEPVMTIQHLNTLGASLRNCLGSYAVDCAQSGIHVFSVLSVAGRLLGATGFRFPTDQQGRFQVDAFECSGPRNSQMCEQGISAVMAFRYWLSTDDPQNRIREIRREVFLRRGKKSDTEHRIVMESCALALRRLPHNALRFDALRERVLQMLASDQSGTMM